MMVQTLFPVGIDVSKATLDVGWECDSHPKVRRFPNTPQGFEAVLEWISSVAEGSELHVCLEATATYHDALARFLWERGVKVSLLPSSRLPAFRASEGKRSKTDQQDALLLTRYCQQKRPAAWSPRPQEQEQLCMLLQRLEALDKMSQQERNRLENSRLDSGVREQIQAHRQQLAQFRDDVLKQALAWVNEHEELEKAFQLVLAQKGIGPLSALRLLCLFGSDASRFPSTRQVVGYVGLDVVERQSGTSVRGRGHISKQGPGQVRKWLGMCALVARRWDPDMRQFAQELKARGKKGKQIQVAVMRKLLQISYGLLKHQQEYDSQKAWPTHGSQVPETLACQENTAA